MSYSAEISRGNPTCFLFLIDQSGSMEDTFGGEYSGSTKADTKADAVANAINRLYYTVPHIIIFRNISQMYHFSFHYLKNNALYLNYSKPKTNT